MSIIKRKCIFILGMHRSGTSAMSGLLYHMGISLGKSLMSANKYNEKGHFENIRIYRLNDKLFEFLGVRWDKTFLLKDNWWQVAELDKFREELIDIIRFDYEGDEIFCIKDPRLCILLPFYQDIFVDLGICVYYSIVVRHPIEIEKSLSSRERFASNKSYILWYDHLLKAELYTRHKSRIFVHFDQLLGDLRTIVRTINHEFQLEVSLGTLNWNLINDFIEPNLRHFKAGDTGKFRLEYPDLDVLISCLESLCWNRIGAFESQKILDLLYSQHNARREVYGESFWDEAENEGLKRMEQLKSELNNRFELITREIKERENDNRNLLNILDMERTQGRANEQKLLQALEDEIKSRKKESDDLNSSMELQKGLLVSQSKQIADERRRVDLIIKRIDDVDNVISGLVSKVHKLVKRTSYFEEVIQRINESFVLRTNYYVINLFKTLSLQKNREKWRKKRRFWLLRMLIQKACRSPLQFIKILGIKNISIFLRALGKEKSTDIVSNFESLLVKTRGMNGGGFNRNSSVDSFRNDSSFAVLFENDISKNSNGRNILLVAHSGGRYLYGGERSFIDLAEMIAIQEYGLIVVVPENNPDFVDLIKPFARKILFFRYGWWTADNVYNEDSISIFKEILISERIDLVHVNTIMTLDAVHAANQLNVLAIIHAREVISKDEKLSERLRADANQVKGILSKMTKNVIVNSNYTKNEYCDFEKVYTLKNTVSDEFYALEARLSEDVLKVGLISSNIEKKGVRDFVALASEIFKVETEIEFYLIGEMTNLTRELKTDLELGKISANLKFPGYFENSIDAVMLIDVVVNFSLFAESFGRTILEAMSAGRPVIIYDHGALPELVSNDSSGFTIDYRKWDQAIPIILKLHRDRDFAREIGKMARESIIPEYRLRHVSHQLNKIYEELFQKHIYESNWSRFRKDDPMFRHQLSTLRIGYFLWHFPVPSETFVINELRYLHERGYDLKVFCKESPYKEFTLDFDLEWQNVSSPEELAEYMKVTDRNIMHSHFAYPTVTNFLWPACENAGVPFTFIAHAQDIFKYQNIELNNIMEISRSYFCLRIFVPGMFHMNYLVSKGVPEYKLIINTQAIRSDKFLMQSSSRYMMKPKRRSICSIGRFVPKKGFEYLIRSAKYLVEEEIDVYLYGYGELEDLLRSIVLEEGLNNVVFGGSLEGAEAVSEALKRHDIFVQPSIRSDDGDMDGLPTVIIEAMSVGTPVISTLISSIPEIVEDGKTGLSIKVKDSRDIATRVVEFFKMPYYKKRMIIDAARKRIEEVFNVESTVEVLLRTWSGKGIDIILVTYNKMELVDIVLHRLFKFTNSPFRVIIVDNSSDQNTLKYLRRLSLELANITLIESKSNIFVGPATNMGLEISKSRYALYLCSREGYILKHNWDRDIFDFMDKNLDVGLSGTLCYSSTYLKGSDFKTGVAEFENYRNRDFAEHNPDRVFKHVQGGVLVIRNEMYKQIGGFSEKVPHNYTDVEYSYYAESMGWRLGIVERILSIFNKTRPGIFSRMSGYEKIVHPGSPQIIETLDKISSGELRICNICGWAGQAFDVRDGHDLCPSCGSNGSARMILKFFIESDLTYRNLTLLSCRLPAQLKQYFEYAFDYHFIDFTLENEICFIDEAIEYDLIFFSLSSDEVKNRLVLKDLKIFASTNVKIIFHLGESFINLSPEEQLKLNIENVIDYRTERLYNNYSSSVHAVRDVIFIGERIN